MADRGVTTRGEAVRFAVRVKPRASRDLVRGVHEGALEVSVTAPPVEGEANAAVVKLVASALGVGRSAVSVVAGATGKQKVLEVTGVAANDVRQRLGWLP